MSPSPTPGKALTVAITLRRPAAVACSAAPRVFFSRFTPKPSLAVSFGTFTVADAVTATVRPVAAPAAAGRRAQVAARATTARTREVLRVESIMPSLPLSQVSITNRLRLDHDLAEYVALGQGLDPLADVAQRQH